MTTHPRIVLASILVLALSHAASAAPTPPTPTPPPARAIHRFDVAVSGLDEGGHPATYTLILQENNTGELATGTNVPMNTGTTPSPRMDVGLKIRLNYTLRGSVVVVEGDLELS